MRGSNREGENFGVEATMWIQQGRMQRDYKNTYKINMQKIK